MNRRPSQFVIQTTAILCVLAIWQAATQVLAIPAWLLPSPVDTGAAAWTWRGVLMLHFGVTLYETLVGFLCALAVSVPLAALLVVSKLARQAIYPIITAIQSIPKAATAPLLLIWFGAGILPKITIVFLVCFFPILVNTVTGMENVKPELMYVMRSLSASRLQVIWMIRLPNALPHIFGGCKVAITLAVIGAIVGEFVGADSGLGYFILISSSQLKTDQAFAAIVVLAAMGAGLFGMIGLIERVASPWYLPQQRELQFS